MNIGQVGGKGASQREVVVVVGGGGGGLGGGRGSEFMLGLSCDV